MGKKLLACFLIAAVVALPHTASAHVLIRDETQTVGAVLHITPDDDPVAGEQSELYFDIQGAVIDSAELQITDGADQVIDVPTEVENNTIQALHTFPSQGVYDLRLAAVSGDTRYELNHAQRVTRGTVITPLSRPSYAWAEMALIASACTFLLLMIIAYSHRHTMAKRSTF